MNRKRGYILILVAALTYSTTEVALKMLAGQFAPMQLTVERVFIGSMVLLPFALRYLKKNDIHLTKADVKYFLGIGFVSVFLQMVFLQLAVMEIDASAAAVLYSGSPIISVFAAHFILHEPVKKNNILALALMTVGIVIILDPLHLTMSMNGFVKIMVATVAFGLYGVLCKLRLDRFNGLTISCFALFVGDMQMFVLLLLGKIPEVASFYTRIGLSLFANVPFTTGFTLQSTLALFYVGAIVAGVGFFLTAQIARDTSATEASFVYLLKPIFATVIAAQVLHETVSVNRIIGIGFFMAASLCVAVPALRQMKRQKRLAVEK